MNRLTEHDCERPLIAFGFSGGHCYAVSYWPGQERQAEETAVENAMLDKVPNEATAQILEMIPTRKEA